MKKSLPTFSVGILARRLLNIKLGRLYQYTPRRLSVNENSFDGIECNLPKISLVTPSLNQALYIGETIQSVIRQRYANLQYIIQDANSKDGTQEIIMSHANHQAFDIHIETDLGQADALNRGFARSDSEIMGYLNSDDLLLPGTLHLIGRYFRDHPTVDVIYGNRLIINQNGYEIGRWVLPYHDAELLRTIDYIPQESMFWRRRIWVKVGACFDATLQFAMDWDLILRFIEAKAIFSHLPGLFGVFRAHPTQKTQADYLLHGVKEMSRLRARYNDKASYAQRAYTHGRFLLQHIKADMSFNNQLQKKFHQNRK